MEEALPRLNERDLEKGFEMVQGKDRSGMRWLPPEKFPWDLTEETRREVVEFLEKIEQSGKWPQQACTTMFFLIPKNVTSERPIALMPAKWQLKYRVDWGSHGLGAMEELNEQFGKLWKWRGSNIEREKNWERWPWFWTWRSRPPCGLGLGDALQLPKEDLAGALWVLRPPEASVNYV